MLAADGATVVLGGRTVLAGASLALAPGEFLAVLGPNGAGKSTLLRVLSGELRPATGRATLDGLELSRYDAMTLARRRAVLPQSIRLRFSHTAREVVELGRHPHRGAGRAEDASAVLRAMRRADVAHLDHRDYVTLSGGEQQRVSLARVLAQLDEGEGARLPRYLLLDEPTASLDPEHQHAVMRIARELSRTGLGVLSVLHDMNLAAAYADRLVVLHAGRVVADGPPAATLTPELIERVFRIPVAVSPHPANGRPFVLPLLDGHEPAVTSVYQPRSTSNAQSI